MERSEPAASSEVVTSAVSDDEEDAPDERGAERWTELARAEVLVAAGQVEEARQQLAGWVSDAPLSARVDGLEGAEVEILARRVDLLAGKLSLYREQLSARELLCSTLNARLAEHDHDRLEAMQDVLQSYFRLGDYGRARVLAQELVDLREASLPPDDLERYSAKHDLGVSLWAVGELRAALEIQEEVHSGLGGLVSEGHWQLVRAKQSLAATRKALGNYRGALVLEEEVYAAREKTLAAESYELLAAEMNLAMTRFSLRDYDRARPMLEHVHATWERTLPATHPSLLTAKQNLALARSMAGDLEGALALEEQVHAAREATLPPGHIELVRAKGNLALTRGALGDLEGALELTEYVHDQFAGQFPADHPDVLRAKINLAFSRESVGDLAGALKLEEDVFAIREQQFEQDHPDLLNARLAIANTCKAMGDLDRALALEESVRAIWSGKLRSSHPTLLGVESGLASTYIRLGRLDEAQALAEHVYTEWSKRGKRRRQNALGAQTLLALVCKARGDLEGALAIEERVLAALTELVPEDDTERLTVAMNLAGTRFLLGDVRGALALTDQVHTVRERVLRPGNPELLKVKGNLAVMLLEVGESERAAELAEEAHLGWVGSVRETHRDRLTSMHSLAMLRLRQGDFEGARRMLMELRATWERLRGAESSEMLILTSNLAIAEYRGGEHARALELMASVHSAYEDRLSAGSPRLLAAKFGLGTMQAELGDEEALRATAESLLAGEVEYAAAAATHAPRAARAMAQQGLARLGEVVRWADLLDPALAGDIERRAFEALASLRGISVASGRIARAAVASVALESELSELVRAKRRLADVSLAPPNADSELDAWSENLIELSQERDRIERAVRRHLFENGIELELPTVASLAKALGPDEVLICYWRCPRYRTPTLGDVGGDEPDVLVAFVLTVEGVVRRVTLGAADEVELLVARWRSAVGRSIGGAGAAPGPAPSEERLAAGRALRAAVLDPCLEAAKMNRPSTVLVVPDDVLHLVPLDALPLNGPGLVGDEMVVRVEPSVGRLVARTGDRSAEGDFVAMAAIDYWAKVEQPSDGSAFQLTERPSEARGGRETVLPDLPETKAEVEAIEALFATYREGRVSVLTGSDATEAELRERVVGARYLHIATHGRFEPESVAVSMLDRNGADATDALRLSIGRANDTVVGFLPETLCGLALAGANHGSGGIFTAEELGSLDLTNCDLAVLSACETNVGIRRAGQGIQSLQTALHAAGARTAITSLWKVDDEATRELFTHFYTALWRDGMGKAEALWSAKTALRSEGYPIRDWAGWVLTGDPN